MLYSSLRQGSFSIWGLTTRLTSRPSDFPFPAEVAFWFRLQRRANMRNWTDLFDGMLAASTFSQHPIVLKSISFLVSVPRLMIFLVSLTISNRVPKVD